MAGRIGSLLGSFLFLVIAPGTVAGWIPYALTRWRIPSPSPGGWVGQVVGGVLVAAGALFLVECFWRFATEGRGTPAPIAPTEKLVVSGPYRYVRNPMYVAVLATIVGQALFFGSVALLVYAAVVWLLVHGFVVIYEEPTLRRRYGGSYDTYRANVRRWWPRMKPWADGGST